ncbi:hypothetical protein MHC_06001 [Mycoplasma haemocanis str. Illinois]|uniref:Uncharacterized protein n=1 Tax=Mycoplasma haemocanis (strain Illinois) TaxID=1111676 RepID=I6RHR9_MYCHN|nr:hypothetical protein [Mycoplasma haemocanis]AFM45091.1 hypothetical protein MHC_06001 [Mycoplasma haemocanis str. Illinois]
MWNSYGVSKRGLKCASLLDIFGSSCWALLILISYCYHRIYLLSGAPYSALNIGSQDNNATSVYSSTLIREKGYSALFNLQLADLFLFKITLWNIVFPLFILAVVCFIFKVLLSFAALVLFVKKRKFILIKAALFVMFIPMLGGIVGLNIYNSKVGVYSFKSLSFSELIKIKAKTFRQTCLNPAVEVNEDGE